MSAMILLVQLGTNGRIGLNVPFLVEAVYERKIENVQMVLSVKKAV